MKWEWNWFLFLGVQSVVELDRTTKELLPVESEQVSYAAASLNQGALTRRLS